MPDGSRVYSTAALGDEPGASFRVPMTLNTLGMYPITRPCTCGNGAPRGARGTPARASPGSTAAHRSTGPAPRSGGCLSARGRGGAGRSTFCAQVSSEPFKGSSMSKAALPGGMLADSGEGMLARRGLLPSLWCLPQHGTQFQDNRYGTEALVQERCYRTPKKTKPDRGSQASARKVMRSAGLPVLLIGSPVSFSDCLIGSPVSLHHTEAAPA